MGRIIYLSMISMKLIYKEGDVNEKDYGRRNFIVADNEAMIYEYVEGDSWDTDEFPSGIDNAYRLRQYVGYNHQVAHKQCGVFGAEDVTDFYASVFRIWRRVYTHIGTVMKLWMER